MPYEPSSVPAVPGCTEGRNAGTRNLHRAYVAFAFQGGILHAILRGRNNLLFFIRHDVRIHNRHVGLVALYYFEYPGIFEGIIQRGPYCVASGVEGLRFGPVVKVSDRLVALIKPRKKRVDSNSDRLLTLRELHPGFVGANIFRFPIPPRGIVIYPDDLIAPHESAAVGLFLKKISGDHRVTLSPRLPIPGPLVLVIRGLYV